MDLSLGVFIFWGEAWQPTSFVRFERMLGTSMSTARIVTDAGPAFIKAKGNPEGPHHLACEWVGTQLAAWFCLPTLPFALLQIDESVDEIPFTGGGFASSGTAFVTQATAGHSWGGSSEELELLVNPGAISQLVLFDTWIRNIDRYPPPSSGRKPNYDNVFLADVRDSEWGTSRLLAIDHTHCLCGTEGLNGKVASIDRIKDDEIYGLFPGFRTKVREGEVLAGVSRLKALTKTIVGDIVDGIPRDWDVPKNARSALIDLIVQRADFVANGFLQRIAPLCWPGKLFDIGEHKDSQT